MTALYEAIAQSPFGFGFVDEADGTVTGFIAFSEDLKGLYKSVLKKHMIWFSIILASKIVSFKTLKKILETLLYPSHAEAIDLPKAELLSIVVSEQSRGKGIAKSLIRKGLLECPKRDIEKVKVLVADFNKPANALYLKSGFELAAQIKNHGVVSNVYVVSTDHFENNE